MPRQSHGRPLLPTSGPSNPKKRKAQKGRGLNALEAAEREFPDQVKIRRHRLGEAEDEDENNINTRRSQQDGDDRSTKRRKLASNDAEEEEDEGSDPDGNPWHVGVDEDDDDSDIDSDEAFGESDEERFADFTFRGSAGGQDDLNIGAKKGSKSKQRQRKDLDLLEDEVEADEDMSDAADSDEGSDQDSLGEDAVDLAAAWDMDDEDERKEQERAAKKQGKSTQKDRRPLPSADSSDQSAESSADEGSDEDDAEEYEGLSVSEDDGDEDTTARLRKFVDGLTPAEKVTVKEKPVSAVRALPDKPSPYALSSAPITAADLMKYVKDPTQRQSLKILQQAEREEPSAYKGGIPGKLAAPLAKRQQDRLDRVAAYDQTKQTLDRWVDTVKNNRRAEHISFPLIDQTKASASGVKSLSSLVNTEPQNELEAKIQEIMRESGYNVGNGDALEGDQQKYEELKEKHIPLEEVQARRKELRMQRELMFREEIRAKRIKKIKSKAYRRVHRKEKDKFAVQERERLLAAGVLNSDEEREKTDKKRAEERMGARHRESRWAKAAKATGQTTWNDDAKSGVSEMARRDEELRRRIEGKNIRGSEESGSESDDEGSTFDSEEDDARWNEKLDELKDIPQATGKSKLADMAFMRKAEAQRKAANDEDLRLLRRAADGEEGSFEDGSDHDDAPGRQKFGKPTKKQNATVPSINRLEFEERLSDEDLPNEDETPDASSKLPVPQTRNAENVALVPSNGNSTVRANGVKPASAASKSSASNQQTQSTNLNDYTSPSESEGEPDNDGLDAKDRLALEIFAGDEEEDLRKQFIKEKKQIAREEGDQVIDNTLPGWGSWTGAGVSKKAQNKNKGKFTTTIKGIAPEARKDAKLDKVIINERRIKKNSKYLAPELPHPFESRQQYERSLRLPMGPEWSTRNHFQDAIKPRVLLKQGHVIKPMTKPIA